MLVLNFETAKLVTLTGEKDKTLGADTKNALEFYLRQYLTFLAHAGNHVLFDLPDFDDDNYKAKIDYATHKDTTIDLQALCHGVNVRDIDVKEINDILYFRWQNAARRAERPADFLSLCLAELSSAQLINSDIDRHFFIRFGIPEVKVLCSREVILTFDIRNIAFFKTADFNKEAPEAIYADWSISFIVGVEREEGSKHITLKLDTARYASRFSTYKNVDTLVANYFKDIVHFLSVDYLDILVQYSVHVIQLGSGLFLEGAFGGEESEVGSADWTDDSDDESGEHVRQQGEVVLWTQRIESIHLFGFDHILALSEASINSLFINLWKNANSKVKGSDTSFSEWSLDLFSASFQPISVRLISSGKAVVVFTISSGELGVKKETEKTNFWTDTGIFEPIKLESTEKFEFGDITIAFEVDLELKEHKELSVRDSWYQSFQKSFIYKYRRVEEHIFKHLLLNFHKPKYIDALSNVAALGKGRDSPARLDTLLHYMKHYLLELDQGGHNVIHTIPVFTNKSERTFGFTSVAHKVVSKSTITVKNCGIISAKDAPIVLIVGMCNFRPMPLLNVEWFAGWIIENKRLKSFGTLCLSKNAFLEGRLLPLLSGVNAATTIVPKFANVVDGDWHFDITTWKEDIHRSNKACRWTQRNGTSHSLEYVWEHHDEWNHKHKGSFFEGKKNEYSLSCHTKNELHIPTLFCPNGLEIKITGESNLRLGGEKDGASWTTKTSAKWSASIFVYSRASGLVVEVTGQTHPVIVHDESRGQCTIDVSGLHAKYLPDVVDMDYVLKSLKSTLEGGWEFAAPGSESYSLANPVFTRNGDLIVQLCERKTAALEAAVVFATLPPAVSYSEAPKKATGKPATNAANTTTGSAVANGSGTATNGTNGAQVNSANVTTPKGNGSNGTKITLPPAAPLGLNSDLNASVSTLDSPELKTPSSVVDQAVSPFIPASKASKPGKGKVESLSATVTLTGTPAV